MRILGDKMEVIFKLLHKNRKKLLLKSLLKLNLDTKMFIDSHTSLARMQFGWFIVSK